jgi:hypothetical protein
MIWPVQAAGCKHRFPSISFDAMYPARTIPDSKSQIATTGIQGTEIP